MSDVRERLPPRRISAERWQTLEPLIDQAVAIVPEERPGFLDSVCKGDASLRAELMALLEAHDRNDLLLDGPAAERFASLFSPATASPPEVLGDRYRVERELGRGGMATVYLADDIRHARKVAVKILHPELAAALGAEYFLREIRTTAQLHHPHILPLHDSGETDGMLYYVMPYVEGESLRRRLERERQLPIETALRIAYEIAGALDFAHRRGVIHRDIKPENILFQEGNALVADFGIALVISAVTESPPASPGVIVGTPQYMSPEQANGDGAIDARADIYALGAVLYEMLAGRPPYSGATAVEIKSSRDTTPAPSLHAWREGIPMAVEAVVARALAREAEHRFGSASEFAAALEEALRPAARDGSILKTAVIRRRWMIAAAVGPVLAIAGVALLLRPKELSPPTVATREKVLVTAFKNRTGDSTMNQIGPRVAEYASNALAKTKVVDVVGSSFEVWNAHERPTQPPSVETLVRQTEATIVVSGSYDQEGDSLVFSVQGLDKSKAILFGFNVAASAAVPGQAEKRVLQYVMSAIATRVDPALKPWAENESAPPVNFEAYQEFADGMTSFVSGITSRRGSGPFLTGFASAQAHLERAFRLDSTYYMPAIWWIFSRENVADSRGADSLISALERHRASMSPYERALYKYVVADFRGTPEQRYQIDSTLLSFAPASEYRYCLARDALLSGHPEEALKALESVDESYAWAHLMPVASIRVRALIQLRQFDRALSLASQAQKDSPGNLSTVYPEVDGLGATGRLDEIDRAVSAAAAAPGVSDADAANLMLYAGLQLQSAGRMTEGRSLFAKALAAYTSVTPDAAAPELIRFGMARSLYYLEQWEEARKLFDTLAVSPPGTSRYDRKAVLYLGSLAARRGDTAEVSRLRARIAKSFPKKGEAEYFEAHIAALLGQTDRALTWLGTAMDGGAQTWGVLEEADSTPSTDPDFTRLRRLPRFQRIVARW